MKRVKKPKHKGQKQLTLTENQLKKIKHEVCDYAVRKACLLFLIGVADELGASGDQLEQVMIRVDRYANHVDDHLVRMHEVSQSLYKNTGIDIRW